MDVKSAFCNKILSEEVYIEQPKGLEDSNFPNHVYRLKKALYGLKQAPKAWYERLTTYLQEKKFERGVVDRTLFINRFNGELLVSQTYVDDIVFGAIFSDLTLSFSKEMKTKFKMSIVGELTFYQDRALKSMICCNRFGIHYSFNDIPNSLLSIIFLCIILYEHSNLVSLALYMTWVHQELYERSKSWDPCKQMICSQSVHGLRQSILGCSVTPSNWRDSWSWPSGQDSHGKYTRVYGYTFDRTYGES